jgi:uncharacterized RDD family membrane protein YckC
MQMNSENSDQLIRATPGHRIAAVAVDFGLSIVTFNIGWIIWNFITMAKGQSPGKQLLKVRVIGEATGMPATWGHMAIRQILIPMATSIFFVIPYSLLISRDFTTASAINSVLVLICLGLYLAVWLVDIFWLFTGNNRRLIDYWAKTIVVNEAV